MNPVTPIIENHGMAYQTSPVLMTEIPKLARVAAIIRKYFITKDEWNLRPEKGSVTFQKKDDQHLVIKLFIDHGLSTRRELQITTNRLEHVVVGIEITQLDTYTRESIRDRLSNDFGAFYSDPRYGGSKIMIQPIYGHFYDVVFLSEGSCEFEISDAEYVDCFSELQEAYQKMSSGAD